MDLKRIVTLISLLIENKKPKFALIDISEQNSSIAVIFKEINSGKVYQQDITSIFSKTNLLKQFSSFDACKIGYAHGKYLSYKEAIQNDKNKSICNGTNFYNHKTFC